METMALTQTGTKTSNRTKLARIQKIKIIWLTLSALVLQGVEEGLLGLSLKLVMAVAGRTLKDFCRG